MKLFTNLPGSLRFLFGLLRVLTIVFALFWFLTLAIGSWMENRKSGEPRFMVNFGEVVLRDGEGVQAAKSAGAKPGSITVGAVYGNLFMDFAGSDAATASALRQAMFPAMGVTLIFCWLLFGSLRAVCANIERGEVFSERNLRLVRGLGLILIGYGVAGAGVQFWATHVMNGLLKHQVVQTGLEGIAGTLRFRLPPGMFPIESNLVVGCLVLLMAEVFRQGLALKTETDLTV